MSCFLTLVMVVVAVVVEMVAGDPISKCEVSGQLVADKDSCTRYHICTPSEDNQFVTQIATCPEGYLYDLVTEKCIAQSRGYVQDPEGCVHFYGCHRPTGGGEGLMRRHYRCPGDLRFHPMQKKCTYKIFVPDALCANRRSSETILGQRTAAVIAFSTPTTTSTPQTTPETTTTTTTTTTPRTTITTTSSTTTTTKRVTTTAGKVPPKKVTGGRPSKPITPRPAGDVTDLERITSVIKDQLLNSRKVTVPASSRDK